MSLYNKVADFEPGPYRRVPELTSLTGHSARSLACMGPINTDCTINATYS
jgi:hypothetical protein